MAENTALAVVTPTAIAAPRHAGPLRPVARPVDLIEAHKEAATVIREALEDGRDYGRIPGAGDRKVLLKAGAERLSVAFGLRPVFSIISQEADHDREVHYVDRYKKPAVSYGLYRFVVKCQLERDGVVVGEGIGSCSTMESKYISRPRDCENTALKMAKKRATVDAVLSTLSLSDRFTQDVDDSDEDEPAPRPSRRAAEAEVVEPAPKPVPTFDLALAMKLARLLVDAKDDESVEYGAKHVEQVTDDSDLGKKVAAGLNALCDYKSAHLSHLKAVRDGEVAEDEDFVWRPAKPEWSAAAEWIRKGLARFEAAQAEKNSAATAQ